MIDAKTMSENPIAVIDMPCRVPYGFHAFFLTEVSNMYIYIYIYIYDSLV